MWRHDASRSNHTSEALSSEQHLQWKRQLPPVAPAFHKARLQFDGGYEPIIAGNSLFVAQPDVDAVVSYALDSGEEQWRFYAEGPVRLAPVAWEGNLYVGSDDGNLYCLDAITGTEQWKFRAVPASRKIFGNGRLISVWPLRGGPVLADGTIYFAAGVWPLEGVFVYALDATTGAVKWVNDRCGSLFGQTPHGGQAIGGLTPQGYLLVNGDDLVVPCGTAKPATLNRHTGELIDFKLPGEGRAPGGWFMMADTQEARDIRRGIVQFDSEVNQDLHEDKPQPGDGVPGIRRQLRVGEVTMSYGDGIDGVEGTIHSMATAGGRLVVTTLEGAIYCFGDGPADPQTYPMAAPAAEESALTPSVTAALDALSVKEGYALVLGTDNEDVARQLAAHSALRILVALPQAEAAAGELRRQLDQEGLLNKPISVLEGDLLQLSLPPYFADLIVVENEALVDWNDDSLVAVYACLRPYGGVACLPLSPDRDGALRSALDDAGYTEATIKRDGATVYIRREGALPGSVDYTKDWTAPDALVRAPLGILWYDDSVAHFKRAPQPYILGGVMVSRDKAWTGERVTAGPVNQLQEDGTGRFAIGEARFTDVYTGRVMTGEEAAARMGPAPEGPKEDFRPPYQYRPPYVDAYYAAHKAKGTNPGVFPFLVPREKGEMVNPITGETETRRYVKSYGCDGGNDYGHLITMRSATPAFYDKRIESGTINISGPRSGCTNSIIPANGVLNMPYFYDGCVCSYPLPTGASLVSMPQTFEQWTAWGPGAVGPMARIGINFGAPGDRMTTAGTLFVDYPSVGGPSPEIGITTVPENPKYFYHHTVFSEGGTGWPWVTSSSVEGLTSLQVTGLKSGNFTVRLYFAEAEETPVGARVFNVKLQGETVLEHFDIVADGGGTRKGVVKEFTEVAIDGNCEITLESVEGTTLLSGIELVLAGLPLDQTVVATR